MIEQVFCDEWGRVLASLVGFLGDLDLAEDVAQEAFAIAVERWPQDGVPAKPGAWLVTTARNRALDRLRRERTLAARTRLLEVPRPVEVEVEVEESTIPDQQLELILMCCHPAALPRRRLAKTRCLAAGLRASCSALTSPAFHALPSGGEGSRKGRSCLASGGWVDCKAASWSAVMKSCRDRRCTAAAARAPRARASDSSSPCDRA